MLIMILAWLSMGAGMGSARAVMLVLPKLLVFFGFLKLFHMLFCICCCAVSWFCPHSRLCSCCCYKVVKALGFKALVVLFFFYC